MTYIGNIVDITNCKIYYGQFYVENEHIESISYLGLEKQGEPYYMPGFVDAHVHVESSMLTPSQFARLAVVHGTVGTVSDPHEIANVLGLDGIKYMIEDGKRVPFTFCFGAPSCVPATKFETAGAEISIEDINYLLGLDEIGYLAEMMNFPGVLHHDPKVMEKIELAKAHNKPIDGHAPGLRGENIQKYIRAGISTDHECFTYDEALEKLTLGMKILIREGSAAKNFDALIPLANEHYKNMMFCSDDKHPDNLVEGHINLLFKRAIAYGIPLFSALSMATVNPIKHYKMDIGLLNVGDKADFVLVDNLSIFNILATYIKGKKVAEFGRSLIPNLASPVVNNFTCDPIDLSQIRVAKNPNLQRIRAIEVIDGQLVTERKMVIPSLENDTIITNLSDDILKIVVVNRYKNSPPAVAFIHNFALKTGAIASSVGHDSHNIVAVGVDDSSICEAINLIIKERGGIAAIGHGESHILPLPIAGLISDNDGYQVAEAYTAIDQFSKKVLGSTLTSPFMSLSFMALLVIPSLKLSDLGLFDGDKFEFVDVCIDG
jgi:adenine deaminase